MGDGGLSIYMLVRETRGLSIYMLVRETRGLSIYTLVPDSTYRYHTEYDTNNITLWCMGTMYYV